MADQGGFRQTRRRSPRIWANSDMTDLGGFGHELLPVPAASMDNGFGQIRWGSPRIQAASSMADPGGFGHDLLPASAASMDGGFGQIRRKLPRIWMASGMADLGGFGHDLPAAVASMDGGFRQTRRRSPRIRAASGMADPGDIEHDLLPTPTASMDGGFEQIRRRSQRIRRGFLPLQIAPPSTTMAKTKQGKKDVDSYTIRGTNKLVHVGDCVLMRASDSDNQPYVARVEKMEADGRGSVRVRVRWYYRPEESKGGRRQFHGAKELFLSDHFDLQSAHTIEGKCVVHSFKNYTKLDNVGPEDFFCRFEYKAATGSFTPDRVAVYCKCEMPYNPDDLMVQCDACKDWFHPSCMSMTIEQAKKLDHFVCSDCLKENGSKRLSNAYATSPNSEPKTESKRQRK